MDKAITWLLDEKQPSVRYYALKDLLDRPDNDPDVKEAYNMIPKKGWAASILKEQLPDGYWASNQSLYRPKYSGTNWKLIVLSDLGLTSKDPRVRKTCEFFLKTYPKPDGGFGGPKAEGGHFCITGNLGRVLIKLGYSENRHVKNALNWLVEHQKEDGGWHCFNSKKGTLDCWEALSAFAALPKQKWTKSIKNSVEHGAEFFLQRELHKEGKRYEPWFRFHYPIHYYYDILVGLDTITALGYTDDKRLAFALKHLRKRRKEGKWILDAIHPDISPNDPYQLTPPFYRLALERAGRPSRWITLIALKVLKRVEDS
ncbi:MAG: hypothetical protein HYY67_02020 [Thaumarchaeota archaeon]|nr:hypothetical protein [Nitrososphaerota archaeon]